ncbi:putative START-like domain superfamily protein [Helianthus debilis subsp. tardiflorus]
MFGTGTGSGSGLLESGRNRYLCPSGDGGVRSIREVTVISGLPASRRTERLELLDDEKHILSFRVVGGEHRLNNYLSVTSVNEFEKDGKVYTVVLESYIVDIPAWE